MLPGSSKESSKKRQTCQFYTAMQLYLMPPKMFSLVKAQRFLNASLAAQKEYEDEMACNLQ